MSFNIKYRTLFEVDILHWHFLNNGENLWHDITEDAIKNKILQEYSVDQFFEITPLSAKILNNFRMVFKKISKGFKIVTEINEENESLPKVSPEGIKLIIKLEYTDSYFFNYSGLIHPQLLNVF